MRLLVIHLRGGQSVELPLSEDENPPSGGLSFVDWLHCRPGIVYLNESAIDFAHVRETTGDTMKYMVEAVKAYALDNYGDGGFMLEYTTDAELAQGIREAGATTKAAAIAVFSKFSKWDKTHVE